MAFHEPVNKQRRSNSSGSIGIGRPVHHRGDFRSRQRTISQRIDEASPTLSVRTFEPRLRRRDRGRAHRRVGVWSSMRSPVALRFERAVAAERSRPADQRTHFHQCLVPSPTSAVGNQLVSQPLCLVRPEGTPSESGQDSPDVGVHDAVVEFEGEGPYRSGRVGTDAGKTKKVSQRRRHDPLEIVSNNDGGTMQIHRSAVVAETSPLFDHG